MSLVRNEQTKLTATLLNSVAVAGIAVGTIAPGTAAMLGSAPSWIALIVGAVWLVTGSVLHLVARTILRKLVE